MTLYDLANDMTIQSENIHLILWHNDDTYTIKMEWTDDLAYVNLLDSIFDLDVRFLYADKNSTLCFDLDADDYDEDEIVDWLSEVDTDDFVVEGLE